MFALGHGASALVVSVPAFILWLSEFKYHWKVYNFVFKMLLPRKSAVLAGALV